MPKNSETIAILLAIIGTFLLVTQGSFTSLSISPPALFWGVTSAFALAFYSVYPTRLLSIYPAIVVIGWSMLIAGALFSFVHAPWQFEATWDINFIISMVVVVLFGTVIAFYCYLTATKYIGAQTTSLLASAEPLSAAIIAVLWLQVSFTGMDFLGSVLILLAIYILAKKPNQDKEM